jgi:hypothetical protein
MGSHVEMLRNLHLLANVRRHVARIRESGNARSKKTALNISIILKWFLKKLVGDVVK